MPRLSLVFFITFKEHLSPFFKVIVKVAEFVLFELKGFEVFLRKIFLDFLKIIYEDIKSILVDLRKQIWIALLVRWSLLISESIFCVLDIN